MKDIYYTTGEFAKKANVSVRTIRYYDTQGVLRPNHINESGYRLYTDSDFAKLQKILALKFLGFSLEEIIDITIKDNDIDYLKHSFELQLRLIRNKIEQLKSVEQSIEETSKLFEASPTVNDWKRIINLIHITNMKKALIEQYKNSANINARIELHKKFSTNPLGWFQWIYSHFNLKPGMKILELGCGNGELWKANASFIPKDISLVLSDISSGMLKDAKNNLSALNTNTTFRKFDCQNIPLESDQFDIIIANHLLFYLKDIAGTFNEINRLLKPDGQFFCSTYGKSHMKEVEELVKAFDSHISLSEVNLYDIFGLETGKEDLSKYFYDINSYIYEDSLIVNQEKPLLAYILSCHGNQNQYIQPNLEKFKAYIKEKVQKNGGIKITKTAGIFSCKKSII